MDGVYVPLDVHFSAGIIQGSVSVGVLVMDEWKRQLDVLVEETMAFVRTVSGDASKKIEFRQTIAPGNCKAFPNLCNCQWQPKSRPQ